MIYIWYIYIYIHGGFLKWGKSSIHRSVFLSKPSSYCDTPSYGNPHIYIYMYIYIYIYVIALHSHWSIHLHYIYRYTILLKYIYIVFTLYLKYMYYIYTYTMYIPFIYIYISILFTLYHPEVLQTRSRCPSPCACCPTPRCSYILMPPCLGGGTWGLRWKMGGGTWGLRWKNLRVFMRWGETLENVGKILETYWNMGDTC